MSLDDTPNPRPVAWGSAAVRRLPRTGVLLLVADTLAIVAAFYVGVGLRFGFDYALAADSIGALGLRAAAFAACILTGLLSMGLYRPRQRPTTREKAVRIGIGVLFGTILNVVLFYWIPSLSFGRGALALATACTLLSLVGTRLFVLRAIDFNPIKRRVLVIGAGEAALKVRRLRRRADRRRFDVVGFVALSDLERRQAAQLGIEPVVGVDEAPAMAAAGLDEVVVAVDDRRGNLPLEFLLQAKQIGVHVSELVDFLERETECLDLDILRPSWLLYEKSSQTDVLYRWLKRCFDLVFSLVLLVLLAPALALTALAILVEDGPSLPLLYRQERVGRNGRTFALLKFRSMRVDAERDGPQWSRQGDSRVTRVGRVIRRFRLDELPQLVNILKGDMSVVGPRPERPAFVGELSRELPLYFYRHCVRPGLTGWAQLNFPYGSSVEDARVKLTYDLYYIKNTNIVTDLLILLQTAEVVIWGRGTSMAGNAPPFDAPAVPAAPKPAGDTPAAGATGGSGRKQDVA